MIALFVALLSVGEAFYSPRVYEYAAAIAPKGQEASYSALSYVPFLIGKLLVGLSRYAAGKVLPGERGETLGNLWLAVASPPQSRRSLIVFRKYARVHEAGRED